jgi:hypothetical protein
MAKPLTTMTNQLSSFAGLVPVKSCCAAQFVDIERPTDKFAYIVPPPAR